MEKLIINSFEEFASYEGKELGTSDYVELTQERINLFADATLDHQWIHVDTERAKTESQFGTTIAHGYLTLSVLPHLWEQIVDVRNVKMLVNYGIDIRSRCSRQEGERAQDNARLHRDTPQAQATQ